MYAVDAALKSMCSPNKIKINDRRILMLLDMELECKLKDLHVKLHAEWWRTIELQDHLLGPHIFLNCSHIKHLCHLGDSGLLTTIDNLCTNFKWNWMDEHGAKLLKIIHDVYRYYFTVAHTMSTIAKDPYIS